MVTTESLVPAFLDAAPASVRPVVHAIPDLDRRLWTLVAEGRAVWPDFPLPAKELVAFVARQLTPELAEGALDGLRPADLYLACACAQRITAAIAAFDRDYMREVDIALARMRIGPPRLADVKQLVRQRLFVGGGTAGTPTSAGKISEYGGGGGLRRRGGGGAGGPSVEEPRQGERRGPGGGGAPV